ncbi:hypothetical protein [Phycicoccus sp. Soil802]|uniref:hypothetical protein n=1 Tax=Phycicoccus sp. Soil802 TaxID=1736414 RepID=UPI000A972382|nr:hypothetical protein [Phycicoccus sp. Soil802]
MPLSTVRVEWTPPRTWFVTARLLEVAAVVAVLGWALQSWQVYQSTAQNFGEDGTPTGAPPFLDRVTLFAMYGFGYGQAPFSAPLACLVLLGLVAILHFAQPVSHASVLRWEVFSLWAVVFLGNVVLVLSVVVALVRGDPNAPPDDGVVRIDTGPSIIEVLAAGATLPVLCLLLLSVSALWWLRLPVDFEAPDEEPDPSVRRPRRWRPAPAPDANVDDLTLDGVELIEPVERLHPRDDDGDGSTPSGYDDYFRRF